MYEWVNEGFSTIYSDVKKYLLSSWFHFCFVFVSWLNVTNFNIRQNNTSQDQMQFLSEGIYY